MKIRAKFLVTAAVFFLLSLFLFAGGNKEFQLTDADAAAGWRFFSPVGFKVKRPAFFDTHGKNVEVKALGEEDKRTDEVLYKIYAYEFFSDELDTEYAAIVQNKNLSDEEKNKKVESDILSKLKPLYALAVLRTPLIGNTPLAEITAYPHNEVLRKTPEFTQIFAFADFNPEGLSESSAELYKTMLLESRPVAASIKCTDPVSAEAMIMKIKNLSFETKDLGGAKVTSNIFKNYDVTMINVWATWCPPCRAELPEIAKLYDTFKEKKCNVLGITGDVNVKDQTALELAKKLTEDAKCAYTILQSHQSLAPLLKKISAWPTTFFVNKKGSVIAASVNDVLIGRRNLEDFTAAMQKALDTVKSEKGN